MIVLWGGFEGFCRNNTVIINNNFQKKVAYRDWEMKEYFVYTVFNLQPTQPGQEVAVQMA